MNEKEIISELESIEAWASGLKEKAAGLRRKLARFNEPASRKRGSVLSDEQIARVLAGREKFRMKKRNAIT